MSQRTRQFFEHLKEAGEALAPGLKNLVPDLRAELSRLATQGTMELASGIFNGNAFVPYGPGQYTPSPEQEAGVHGKDHGQQQPQQERSIER
jgi:hypothetical protein